MTFEEEYNKQPGQNDDNKSSDSEAEKSLPAKVADDILMDYQQLAETKGKPGTGQHIGPHIGLNGGQSKDDDRGIDISQYAGPESRTSNQIDDPEAPYGTGPGNGLNQEQSEHKDSKNAGQ